MDPVQFQDRQPRFRFRVGGATLPLSAGMINLTRHAEASTFEVDTPLAATGMTLGQLNGIGKADIVLEGSNDGDGNYKPITTGVLDRIDVRASPREGVMVIFTGRNKVAKLIDTVRTQKTLNKSSADIVRDIAAKHGLKLDIDSTPGQAGQQHTQDFAHLIDNNSDWSTLAALAEKEGAFLYVIGDTLYFKQAGNDVGQGSYGIHFTPPTATGPAAGNVMEIMLSENVHLSGGVKQTVQSFRTREERTASSTAGGDAGGGASPLQFTDRPPGLTDAQVDAAANKGQIAKERHQLQIDVLLVGDVNIDLRKVLNLSGSASAWDQDYLMDVIHHDFSAERGYTMRIEAKNKKGG